MMATSKFKALVKSCCWKIHMVSLVVVVAMWSLKIDGRIPSFNEIGPLQEELLVYYTLVASSLLVVTLMMQEAIRRQNGKQRQASFGRRRRSWQPIGTMCRIVLTVQRWWDGTPQYVPPDLYMLCACDTMWDCGMALRHLPPRGHFVTSAITHYAQVTKIFQSSKQDLSK